jgi:hypothetical protein
MVTAYVDETTKMGQRVLRNLRENPNAGAVYELLHNEPKPCDAGQPKIVRAPRDANGNIIGHTLDEVFAKVDHKLSEHYGVDFAKVNRLINSGELNLDELTDEILYSPEYKYEPYPGFKPKPLPADFKPNPAIVAALFSEP